MVLLNQQYNEKQNISINQPYTVAALEVAVLPWRWPW